MNTYIVVAGLALVVKFVVLIFGMGGSSSSVRWRSFIGMLSLMNLCEILLYISYEHSFAMDSLIRSYYIFCVICPCFGYWFVMGNSTVRWQSRSCFLLFISAAVIGCALVFSDTLVLGYREGSYPITAIKGPYFNNLLLFCLISVIGGAITALYNYKVAESESHKAFFFYNIVGLSVLILTSLVVTFMMALGLNGNGSMFLPIATTICTVITYYGRSPELLVSDKRHFNPLMREHRLNNELQLLQSDMTLNGLSLRDAVKRFEKTYIDYRIDKTIVNDKTNKSEAARQLNVQRKTLYSKMK